MFRSAKYQVRQIYDIEERPIGTGAFAKVFKGSLKANPNIKVAIKIFEKEKLEDMNVKAIKEEIKVLWKLDHPNIVKYHDVHEDLKQIFIITEYIPGKTLCKEMADRKSHFTEREVALIMNQLISALHHCHASNIAHRDIKPDNVIIDDNMKVTLIDFGLSKSFSKERNLKTKAGSPLFMAPEVDYDPKYSRQCDVWSLGILFYILLSGDLPFSIKHYNRIVKGIEKVRLDLDRKIWETTSKDAKKLIIRMIVVDPAKRITVEELIDHRWFDKIRCESTMSDSVMMSDDAFEWLTEFSEIPLLKHTALRCLVNFIPSQKLTDFYSEFTKIDEDNDGLINFKDLKRSIKPIYPKITDKKIQKIIDKLDFFHCGKIHYTDYLVARVHQSEFIDMKLVESVFKQFDSKWDGKIDKAEIWKEFSNMLRPCSEQEVSEMIRQYDFKKRGYLNFSDFKVMITNP